jgi:hypothetical protein
VVREHVHESDIGLELTKRFSNDTHCKWIHDLKQRLRRHTLRSERDVLGFAVTSGADTARDQSNIIARFPESIAQPGHVCLRSALPAIPVGHDENAHSYISTSVMISLRH